MKKQFARQQGFTLIELMIVIAIVGILAAIALPAYQDYTVRARMSEPMARLAEAKTTISEFYSATGGLPNANQTGINSLPTTIIQLITYASVGNQPEIRAFVHASVIPGATNPQGFQLRGTINNANRTITWVCQPTAANALNINFLPANCRN